MPSVLASVIAKPMSKDFEKKPRGGRQIPNQYKKIWSCLSRKKEGAQERQKKKANFRNC